MRRESYIGIDPSLNSTGICISTFVDGELEKTVYRLVIPNKTTKAQDKAVDEIKAFGVDFDYVIYDKTDLKIFKDDYHSEEYWKTDNLISLIDVAINEILDVTLLCDKNYVLMEGISYGSSLRTKSIFDLAGLNYLLRAKLMENSHFTFNIASPAEIKKFATGAGNANKESIMKLFDRVHPWVKSLKKYDDLADAYFMSRYSKELIENQEL